MWCSELGFYFFRDELLCVVSRKIGRTVSGTTQKEIQGYFTFTTVLMGLNYFTRVLMCTGRCSNNNKNKKITIMCITDHMFQGSIPCTIP